jgi:hypothetical protein
MMRQQVWKIVLACVGAAIFAIVMRFQIIEPIAHSSQPSPPPAVHAAATGQ